MLLLLPKGFTPKGRIKETLLFSRSLGLLIVTMRNASRRGTYLLQELADVVQGLLGGETLPADDLPAPQAEDVVGMTVRDDKVYGELGQRVHREELHRRLPLDPADQFEIWWHCTDMVIL